MVGEEASGVEVEPLDVVVEPREAVVAVVELQKRLSPQGASGGKDDVNTSEFTILTDSLLKMGLLLYRFE